VDGVHEAASAHGHHPGRPGQAEWDARYSAAEGRTWSDNPNSTLVAEAGALIPGQALDVGCGEGADAV